MLKKLSAAYPLVTFAALSNLLFRKPRWVLQRKYSTLQSSKLNVAFVSPADWFVCILQELNEWLQLLQQMANEREAVVQRMVRQANLSQELSDLVVYCQPVPFDLDSKSWNYNLY